MGNSYICTPNKYLRDIKLNICFQYQSSEIKDDQIIININNDTNKYEKKINQLKKYFNENEIKNEIEYMEYINKKKKNKKHLNRKKHNNDLNRLSDNKYELMLKRLLEQKNIKRNGPKRRETIRNEDKIKILINEILFENINEIKNNKNNKNNEKILNQENDLLIKNINNQNFRFSATIDKNQILSNNLNSKKHLYNYQYRNTINEIINESSGYSALCTKQTKQTNSSKNKKYY